MSRAHVSTRSGTAAVALCALVALLLPFGRASELPLLVGACVGIVALARRWSTLNAIAAVRVVWIAGGAYVCAAVVSCLDAVSPEKSWQSAIATIRVPLFAFGILALCLAAIGHGEDRERLSQRLTWAAALPVAIWIVDALVQIASGYSLGGQLDADRLSGIFGADDLKLGPLLPALAPLLLWPLIETKAGRSRWLLSAAYLCTLLVVLMAGSRAGWLSFGYVSALLVWRLSAGSWRRMALWAMAATLAATLAAGVAYQSSPNFQARVDRTLRAGSGDADFALAGRVPIWRTAIAMTRAHPINGVGVRGFRHAYPNFAAANDPWVNVAEGTGAAHAHQIVLELLTETGLIGLLLWITGAVALVRLFQRQKPTMAARAPWIALAILVFPMNTHLAFYSSFLGMVTAWLLALACAQSMLAARKVPTDG